MAEWMIALQILTIALIVAALLAVLGIFHKARKIHLATFRLLENADTTRRESTVLFSQLQALSALENKLGLPQALPPMRGWAGSPDFLLTVADAVLRRKPATVVECSSGVSTLVAARCLQLNGAGHVYSLEHDKAYAGKTAQMLKQYGVDEWATVLYAPLISKDNTFTWYDDSVLPSDIRPIELLVVDGPPHHTAPLARLPAIPRLLSRMADKAVVILDDAAREEEQEIVKQWTQIAPEFSANYLHHEKGCTVLKRGWSE